MPNLSGAAVDVANDLSEPRSQIVIFSGNKSSTGSLASVSTIVGGGGGAGSDGGGVGARSDDGGVGSRSDDGGVGARSDGGGGGARSDGARGSNGVGLSTQSSKFSQKRNTVALPVVEVRNSPNRDDIDANAVVMCEGVNLCAASEAPIPTIFGRDIMEVWYPENLERMIITKNGKTSRRTTKQTVSKSRTKALKSKKLYSLIFVRVKQK
jgi:hypothetical protein